MAAMRLTREKSGAMLGGVCAGIAQAYRLDVTLVRVAFVLLAVATSGLGLVFYVAAWLVMPAAGDTQRGAAEIARANVGDVVHTARQRASDLRNVRPDDVAAGARRAAQDLTRAAHDARDRFARGGASGMAASAPSWTPPAAHPRARHGGFKPPRNTPPAERV